MLLNETSLQGTGALQLLDVSVFVVGTALAGAVRDAEGKVLIPAGKVLKERHLELITSRRWTGVFGGSDWPRSAFEPAPQVDVWEVGSSEPDDPWGAEAPASESHISAAPGAPGGSTGGVSIDELQIGHRLPQALYTQDGVLLAAAGVQITDRFIGRLRSHGVLEVHTPQNAAPETPGSSAPSSQSRLTTELDSLVVAVTGKELDPARTVRHGDHLKPSELREEAEHGREIYERSLDNVSQVSEDVMRGNPLAEKGARDVVGSFLDMVRTDACLLPLVVQLRQTPGEYLYQHATNVALVSITAAAQLGLALEQILEIGVGALLQDIGMLKVPEHLRFAPRKLTSEEREEVERHPIHTLEMLERVPGLSKTVLMIAYQMHERCDRSGYPFGRHRLLIHPFARLVQAADAYVAMTSHRPHREAWSPYDAMVALLREGHATRFDRQAVRALLDSMSLFPVGSLVRLSDGQYAKVLRANPGQHTRPLLVPLNPDGSETDEELDLEQAQDIHIIQALSSPPESP